MLFKGQQPNIGFSSGFQDLRRKTSSSLLAVVVPHEDLFSTRQIIHPDGLYKLLSTRCLAISGLPTPRSIFLDLDDQDGTVEQKIILASSWIRCFILPRVFKTQQGMSSVGTFLIHTEYERNDLVNELSASILRRTLVSVTPTNRHLYPSTLISQEMVSQTSECLASSFFVNGNGECVFLGACRQEVSDSNAWLGACINYLEQSSLRRSLWRTLSRISSFLFTQGYYGPVGVDIILKGRVDDG